MVYPEKTPSRNPEVGFFDEDDTKRIIRKIAEADRLTIFVGAGIAADLEIPNWSNLVARLLERLELSNHDDDEAACRKAVRFALDFFHQMPTASIVDALYTEQYGGQALHQRNKDIADILYPKNGRRGNAHVPSDALAIYVLRLAIAKRLANCDVHIVTTNYDDSLEWIAGSTIDVLSDLGSGVTVFSNTDSKDDGRRPGVPVSHLHGLIPRVGEGTEVVFSEHDYIEWDEGSRWRNYFTKRVAGGGVTLFVGASLRDYNIAAMIRRFSRRDIYALLPVEDEVAAYSAKSEEPWPQTTARYAALRGQHLGLEVLRPDFYGQVCQFLNEAAIPLDLGAPDYSTRLKNWWKAWRRSGPYDTDLLVERCKSLRDFSKREHEQLPHVDHVKAEIWVREDPEARELRLYSTSQTVVLPGDGYWAHCTRFEHSSPYAAVSAFAARRATEGRVNYRNDNRWTHCLAVPIILPEDPHYELPVGVMILLLHAPDITDAKYFGEVGSDHMHALAARMKEIGQEFLRPVSAL